MTFLTRLLPEPRAFDIRLWDGTLLPGADRARLTIVINSPGALRRMLRPPVELALGEAYLRGDFDLEGELWRAGPALEASRTASSSPGDLLALLNLWRQLPRDDVAPQARDGYGSWHARLQGSQHSREWDRQGIQYHYDAGNDFFELFLDRRMVYSCGYFPTGAEDIHEAQERKLDYICRKLRFRRGEHFFDIGCGWGALVIHAASRYGVRALGVTLSEQQHEVANRRIAEGGVGHLARVKLVDYRDVQPAAFDKIASVGMFEHVERERLPQYFDHVYRILKPGGLFLNHGIAGRPRVGRPVGRLPRSMLEPYLVGGSTFRRRYVFPSGGLVPVSEANLVAQRRGFEVRDVENLREHYALTLRWWAQRLEQRKQDAVRFGGERMYRLWRLYMGIASWQFGRGEFDLCQSLLLRPTGGPTRLPLTRADLYA